MGKFWRSEHSRLMGMDPVPAVLYAVSPLTGIDKAWQSLLRLTPFRFNQKYGGVWKPTALSFALSEAPLCLTQWTGPSRRSEV